MSPRGQSPSDMVDYKRVTVCVHVPKTEEDRLETLRVFRNKYTREKIHGWNLRVINEYRGDGQCWITTLFVQPSDKK